MKINVYSIKKATRTNGTNLFIVNVRSTLLASTQAFSSPELAQIHLDNIIKRLSRYNITLTEYGYLRTPKNILNAFINEEYAKIFNSLDEYKAVYPLA